MRLGGVDMLGPVEARQDILEVLSKLLLAAE